MATIKFSPEVLTVAENPKAGDIVATLSVDGGAVEEEFTFELADDLDDRFEIAGDKLRIKTGGSQFDFEAALNSFRLAITATSTADVSPTEVDSASVTVKVTDVNEAPTDIVMAGGTIAENAVIGTEIGILAAADQDAGETLTYTLVDANGAATANAFFEIVDNKIKLKAGLDNAQVGTHSLLVKVTDGELSYMEEITITVTNSAEVKTGSSRNEKLYGTADDDIINGEAGNDKLYGYGGNDVLNGGTGNDMLYGGEGNDTLNGGAGKDKLYGGAGQDVFVFDTPMKKGHFDHIEDFNASDDTIQISLTALKAFKVKGAKADDVHSKKGSDDHGRPDDNGGGRPVKHPTKSVGFDKIFTKGQKLQKKFFDIGTKPDAADGSDDYIYYNKKSGIVYLDVDGSGKAKGIEILKVKPGTTLTADDFLFI